MRAEYNVVAHARVCMFSSLLLLTKITYFLSINYKKITLFLTTLLTGNTSLYINFF